MGKAEPSWADLLDFYLDAERRLLRREYSEPYNGWRASLMGFCLRSQMFKRAGVPGTIPIDAKKRRQFKWGDEIHRFQKLILIRCGLLIPPDPLKPTSTEWTFNAGTMRGHLDALTAGPPRSVSDEPIEIIGDWSPEWTDFQIALRAELVAYFGDALDRPTGIEVKSAHSWAMQKTRKEGPYRHHVVQLASAALAAREDPGQFPVRPEAWKLLYIGKDAMGTLEYDLPGGSIDYVARRRDYLDDAWGRRVLPPCECQELDQIGFCDYGDGQGSCCGISDDQRLYDALKASLDAVGAGTS